MIHRISIPNPFFEGRNNVYVIESDPVTLIDTGVATDKAFQALEDGLQQAGLAIHDIRRVVLTHKHIDHIGNAWRIQRASDAEILIHGSECTCVTDVDPSGERFRSMVINRLQNWGVPDQHVPDTTTAAMPNWELEPAESKPLDDGQAIEFADQSMTVIHTPGHTMGSVCLKYRHYLFSGDHVLRDISPNVGGGDMRRSGMLQRFLDSLRRVQSLQNMQVMPGHGEPFEGLSQRCSTLLDHHDQRLALTLDAVGHGANSVFEVAVELFGKLADFHVVLGCAEANAHLELLVERGQVLQTDSGYSVS